MGNINVCDKFVIENKKKEKIWKYGNKRFLHKAVSKKRFRNGIHSLLR